MTIWYVVLGCVISGAITFCIIRSNRKANDRNARIDKKNELLRDLERRALYIWSDKKDKEFNLALEHTHILSDIKRIEDKYKAIEKKGNASIPVELKELRRVITMEIEDIVDFPESLTEKRLKAKSIQIEDLIEKLESIPSKKQ